MEERLEESKWLFERPTFWKLPHGQKMIVLAPHPDDEIIGMGGTLKRLIDNENDVTIIYITDGRRGKKATCTAQDIIERRQKEASKVCEDLHILCYFFYLEDSKFDIDEESVKKLTDIIEEIEPQYIFLPHFQDRHRDHVYTNFLLKESLEKTRSVIENIFMYEVWTPLNASLIVNITNQFEQKMRLLNMYESQLEIIAYSEMVEGINRYRSVLIPMPFIKYAEGFCRYSVNEYLQQLNSL